MVQKKIKTIVWSKNAANQYYKILEFLEEKASEALSIVGNALLNTIDELATQYNSYPPDRFKKNNDGSFKALVIFSYRISYQITDAKINILRIRHTSREPLRYWSSLRGFFVALCKKVTNKHRTCPLSIEI